MKSNNKYKLPYLFILIMVITLVSCDNSDDDIVDTSATVEETTSSTSSEDESSSEENTDDATTIALPENYVFERNAESTVSFSGQTTRLNQSNELYSALNDNVASLADLNLMFQGDDNGSGGFSDETLNGTSKIIGSKTSASTLRGDALTKAQFVQWLTDYTTDIIPNWVSDASEGNAGQYGNYHFTANGHEIDQLFFKGLIGAFCLDQIVNNYIHPNQLDSGTRTEDNTNEVLSGDNNYTDMEHKWDEGFGYLYGQIADVTLNNGLPADGESSGNLLMKYFKKVEENYDPGIAKRVYDAFIAGRSAIVSKDYVEREVQAKIIKQELSKAVGQYAVHYLSGAYENYNGGADDIRDAFHGLSEGYGFVLSLQFTNDGNDEPYFTKEEVDAYLLQLENFYTLEANTILEMHDEIKSRFGI